MLDFEDATKRFAAIIPLEFWTDHEQKADGEMVSVDFVKWQKIGNPNHCGQDKIERIKKHQSDVWGALEKHYKAWKANEEAPVDGTPIKNWPSVTRKMAELLSNNGFRSVESLAEATDADLSRLGMGAISMRDKARSYVSLKSGDNKIAGLMASMQERLRLLEERNEELEALVGKEKKRGRPPKGE